MATPRFTLTSYDPVYAVCEEVRIPEDVVEQTAQRWLQINVAKDGETAKLNDKWVAEHTDDFNNVEELLIFIRYTARCRNWPIRTPSAASWPRAWWRTCLRTCSRTPSTRRTTASRTW